MALGQCRECKQQVSSEANACPHCGVNDPYDATKARAGWAALNIGGGALGALMLAFAAFGLFRGGRSSNPEPAASSEAPAQASASVEALTAPLPDSLRLPDSPNVEALTAPPPATAGTQPAEASEAAEARLDSSTEQIKSCDWDGVERAGTIYAMSRTDEAAICAMIDKHMGALPAINVLRAYLKVVVVLSLKAQELEGTTDTDQQIAYQLINIVEARRVKTADRIIKTLDTVCKIYQGTDGHVTPKDLNVELRAAGPMAHTMSDDFLITFAAMIWEQKKANGG